MFLATTKPYYLQFISYESSPSNQCVICQLHCIKFHERRQLNIQVPVAQSPRNQSSVWCSMKFCFD